MSSQPSDNFRSLRPDKTLQWLEESRDSWKKKTKTTKDDLKKKKLAVKRARSTGVWTNFAPLRREISPNSSFPIFVVNILKAQQISLFLFWENASISR